MLHSAAVLVFDAPRRHSKSLDGKREVRGENCRGIRVDGFGRIGSNPEVMSEVLAFFDKHLKL
jgi:hypothetical protein